MKNSCLILGTGYVGKFYLKRFPNCAWTRRQQVSEITDENINNQLCFDLKNKETWKSLTDINTNQVLWSFPAASNEDEETKAIEFYDSYLKDKHVIVYGSTSAYINKIENELVDESFPLRLDDFRVRTEEKLRQRGAMIIHLSGIIGPDRYPRSWYERKLVKNGQNILNYIHVDDIVTITNYLFENFKNEERFNLTSGDYKKHIEIADLLKCDAQFVDMNKTNGSKRVDNKKILNYLNMNDYKFKLYPE